MALLAIMLTFGGCSFFKKLRPCPVKGCRVRLTHSHSGEMFSGVPWYKLNKNPKVGQEIIPKVRYPAKRDYVTEKRKKKQPDYQQDEKKKKNKKNYKQREDEAPKEGGEVETLPATAPAEAPAGGGDGGF